MIASVSLLLRRPAVAFPTIALRSAAPGARGDSPGSERRGPKFHRDPVLLLAPHRSGSTLLARLMDAHSQMAFLPETGMFTALGWFDCQTHFRNEAQYLAYLDFEWHILTGSDDWLGALVVCVDGPRGPSRTA